MFLRDSEVTFLGEGGMQSLFFFSFLRCVLIYTQLCIIEEVCRQMFLHSILQGGILSRFVSFLHFFFFFSAVSSSSSVKYLNVMSRWLSIFLVGLSSDFTGVSVQILETFFPFLESFLLVVGF